VDARQRRAVTAAAVVNAALIAVPPFVLALRSTLAASNVVRPPGVSGLPPILTLPLVYILMGLGALAGWRTHVYAVAYAERKSAGWLSVLEPSALGLVIALALLRNGIRTGAVSPQLLAFLGWVALTGLLIGVVLRFTALATMWVVVGTRATGTR